MRRDEMNELCREVERGAARLVQHDDLCYAGRVTACHDNRLMVEAFGHPFEWDSGHCHVVDDRIDPLGPPSNA